MNAKDLKWTPVSVENGAIENLNKFSDVVRELSAEDTREFMNTFIGASAVYLKPVEFENCLFAAAELTRIFKEEADHGTTVATIPAEG